MLYIFGDQYTLDPTGYELRQHGRLVRLEPRVFDCLAYLVQHPDRMVSKAFSNPTLNNKSTTLIYGKKSP